MSRTILAKVNGWTPMIDAIVQKHGLITAAVFGRIWRHCQDKNGVCYASMDTIARELGLSRMTIFRHIDALVKDGYLEDRTPDRKHSPHVYADTGRAQLSEEITATVKGEIGVTESYTSEEETPVGVSESYTGVTESDTQVYQKVTPGVTESDTKKDLKRDLKKEIKENGGSPTLWSKFLKQLEFQMASESPDSRICFQERIAPLTWGGRENGSVWLYAPDADSAAWLQGRMTQYLEHFFDGFPELAGARVEFRCEGGP